MESSAAASSAAGVNSQGQTNVLLLEEELLEVENSIRHLIRSNIELTQAIQEGGPDPDFEQAWLENKGTIAKKQQLAKALRAMIAEVLGQHAPEGAPAAAAAATGGEDVLQQAEVAAAGAVTGEEGAGGAAEEGAQGVML